MVMVVQVVPFHWIANATWLSLWPTAISPTATQSVMDTQDTLLMPLLEASGKVSIVQVEPFHWSANGSDGLPLPSNPPTAMQAPTAGHDTLLSTLLFDPAGCAGVCSVHTGADAAWAPWAAWAPGGIITIADAAAVPIARRRPAVTRRRTTALILPEIPVIAPTVE
jgi:hypothetical protein